MLEIGTRRRFGRVVKVASVRCVGLRIPEAISRSAAARSPCFAMRAAGHARAGAGDWPSGRGKPSRRNGPAGNLPLLSGASRDAAPWARDRHMSGRSTVASVDDDAIRSLVNRLARAHPSYFRFAHGEAEVLDDVVDAIAWDEQQQQQPVGWVSFAHGPAEVFAEAVPFPPPAPRSGKHQHRALSFDCRSTLRPSKGGEARRFGGRAAEAAQILDPQMFGSGILTSWQLDRLIRLSLPLEASVPPARLPNASRGIAT